MAFAARRAEFSRPIPGAVATVGANERVTFIKKTYAHLAGAIAAFAAIEYLLLNSTIGYRWLEFVVSTSWLLVLGLFMAAAWIADRWARSATSRAVQYLGLGLYVVAQAFLILPLIYVAAYRFEDPYLIEKAGVITVALFAGLTGTVFITKKDFSFLRPILAIATMVAFGLIIVSVIWGFNLGTIFAAAMIILAAGFILYDTSQVLAHYRPTQYVAASLALFASIALMFWYVLQLLMSLSSE